MVRRLRGDLRVVGVPNQTCPSQCRVYPVHQPQELGPSLLQGTQSVELCSAGVFHEEEQDRGVCDTEAQMANGIWSFLMDYLYFFFK